MKKVLLINPVYNPGTIPKNIPLSKIATGLRHCGFEITAIDFVCPDCEGKNLLFFRNAEKDFFEKVRMMVPDFDIVYITSSTGNELKPYPIFPRIRTIAKIIKCKKNIPVIVGGALTTLYMQIYKLPVAILCGEHIDHIAFGNEYNSVMDLIVKDKFPLSVSPSWEIWESGKYPEYKSVQYHVGCPYSCDFCFEGKIYDRKSAKAGINDLFSSIEYGEKIVIEDSVLMSYGDFDMIMDYLQSKMIKFSAYARISEIIKEPQKVARLRRAGCQSLIVGIETLDSNLLQGHNKNIISSQTRQGLDILKNNDISIQGCFMLGFPEDSIKNMERTISFAIDEHLSAYRWHIYQPNYAALNANFYSHVHRVAAIDHLSVQINLPDNCLREIMIEQPIIGITDEHFMIRGKEYIYPESFDGIGYTDRFNYKEIKQLIDAMFPKDWILNEELLYKCLFQ